MQKNVISICGMPIHSFHLCDSHINGYSRWWEAPHSVFLDGVFILATMDVHMVKGARKSSLSINMDLPLCWHDDIIKWKHFPLYWPFVRGVHLSPVNSPHEGQWRRALMFSLIGVWTNVWVNNWDAGDLRRHRAHYDVTVLNYSLIICYMLTSQHGGG